MSELGGEGGADFFGRIPLFREFARLMATGGGPVNWELARQVAVATAAGGDARRAGRGGGGGGGRPGPARGGGPGARRMAEALGPLAGGDMPGGGEVLGRVGGLLTGLQTGTLVGQLARGVLTEAELAIPPAEAGRGVGV